MPWFWLPSKATNFGDDYNLDLGAALLHRAPLRTYSPSSSYSSGLWMTSDREVSPKVVACGSVLPVVRKGDVVAGPGGYAMQRGINFDALRDPNTTIASVRGPDTASLLRNHSVDHSDFLPNIDPGLLAGTLVWPHLRNKPQRGSTGASEKPRRVCLIPHGSDVAFERHARRFWTDIHILSVHQRASKMAIAMGECNLILSTSLHGLVFADAFQIPSIWIHSKGTSQKPFKFNDYFASLGHPRNHWAPSIKAALDIPQQYTRPVLSDVVFEDLARHYLESFPFSRVCGKEVE